MDAAPRDLDISVRPANEAAWEDVERVLGRARCHGALFRHRGVSRALEADAMITEPGKEITWGERHVGGRSVLAAAGFREIARPTLRRAVMRIDF